jgi:hypothetical protein
MLVLLAMEILHESCKDPEDIVGKVLKGNTDRIMWG